MSARGGLSTRAIVVLIAAFAALLVGLIVVAVTVLLPRIEHGDEAEAAAAAYDEQKQAWAAVYTPDRLVAITGLESAPFGDAYAALRADTVWEWDEMSVPETTDLTAVCADLTAATAFLTDLGDVVEPARPDVPGAAGIAVYDEAVAEWEENRVLYAGTAALRAQAEQADEIAGACAYVLAEHERDRETARLYNLYLDLLPIAPGDVVDLTSSIEPGLEFSIECGQAQGCAPFDDPAARAAVGQAFAAYAESLHGGMAELQALCPPRMAAACEARAESERALLALGLAVGDAYAADDPRAITSDATHGGDPEPLQSAAWDAYFAESDEGEAGERMRDLLREEYGTDDQDAALAATVGDAVSALRNALTAVTD